MTCVCLFVHNKVHDRIIGILADPLIIFFKDCSLLVTVPNTCNLSKSSGAVAAATQENTRMKPRERVVTSSKHLSHPSCNICNSASSLFTNPVCSWRQFPLSCLGSPSPLFFPSTRLPLPAPVRLELCSCPLACWEGAGRQKSCRQYLSVTVKL